MLEQGFVDEVRKLLEERKYNQDLKPLQSLGYKQIISYLQNSLSLDEAVDAIKRQTRHYAKRQLTWFRKELIDFWVDISGTEQEYFGEILTYLEGRLSKMSNNIS